MFKSLTNWFRQFFLVWRREFRLVLSDLGVCIFFFLLPTAYPIVYTLIYNPEVVKEMHIVAVDHSMTAESRNFLRMVDQTETFHITGYAANLTEAKEAMKEHKAFAIIEVPADFAKKIGRGEQATVPYYSDMSLLLRYRQAQLALTDIQIATGTRLLAENMNRAGDLGAIAETNISQIGNQGVSVGDPTQGFASFIMPGILVLIIQQGLLLGILMLAGTAAQRRRKNGGIDPLFCDAQPLAQVLGRTLCYLVFFLPILIFTLYIVPELFSLPHIGSFKEEVMLMVPMLLAVSGMGLVLGIFCTEREYSFLIIVATSPVFLFISGLTWPEYAMNGFWKLMGDLVPAKWALNGFVRMNSDGGALFEQYDAWRALWILAAVYLTLAVVVFYFRQRLHRKALSERPAITQ